MRSQRLGDNDRHRHGSEGGLTLWRTELRRPGLHCDQLAVDANVATEEVHSVNRQAEALALAQASAGREEDKRAVPLGNCVSEGLDGLDRERDDLAAVQLRQLDPCAR